MDLIRWEPLREMDEFFRQYSPFLTRERQRDNGGWTPTANITETDKEYLIKAELPEVQCNDVKVTLHVDVTGIRAESKDGVLRLHIPKSEAVKPKAITVEVT